MNNAEPVPLMSIYAEDGNIRMRCPNQMTSLEALQVIRNVESMIMRGALEKREPKVEVARAGVLGG